jgi:hypothetical protein
LDSVGAKAIKLGAKPLSNNDSVEPRKVIVLPLSRSRVSDGKW